MNKLNEHKELATLCYIASMRKEIERKLQAKYEKRIDYLVAANNELMRELEICESEVITVEKENGSINFDFTASEEFRTKGATVDDDEVDDRDDFAAVTAAEKKRES